MQTTTGSVVRFRERPPVAGPAQPDAIERMARWLASPAVRDHDGMLRSWSNPDHPGYRYPEATGYAVRAWLDLHRRSGERRWLAEARLSADALRAAADPATGAFGRGEFLYAFDTAVCAAALLDVMVADGGSPVAPALARALDFVAGCLARGVGVVRRDGGDSPAGPSGWSHAFGPHLLKSAAVLARARDAGLTWSTDVDVEQRVAELCARGLDGSRFHSPATPGATYLHAHCYAVEGLLELSRSASMPSADFRTLAAAGCEWLAGVQDAAGALPRWWLEPDRAEQRAADATAQAVRLWCVVDGSRYRRHVERGLAFLAALENPSGGVRYSPEHDDLNTWTTVFALQALLLDRLGSSVDPIA